MTATLPDLVRDKWASLFRDDAFTVTEEDDHRVLLTSIDTRVIAVHDPRGEIDVAVFLHGQEPWQGWSYTGMVGTASAGRVLELALEQMQAEPAVLRGDKSFLAASAERRSGDAEAWTAYYAGRGPRPSRQHPLP